MSAPENPIKEEIIVEEFRKKFGEEIYQQWITNLTYSALIKSWRKKQLKHKGES